MAVDREFYAYRFGRPRPGRTDGRAEGRTDGQTDGRVDGRKGRTAGMADGRKGRTGGRSGRTEGAHRTKCTIAQPCSSMFMKKHVGALIFLDFHNFSMCLPSHFRSAFGKGQKSTQEASKYGSCTFLLPVSGHPPPPGERKREGIKSLVYHKEFGLSV